MQSHIRIPALSALLRFRLLVFILLGLAVLLGGCAPMKLDPAADQKIRNVAVISLVPEQADFIKIGVTVFNNQRALIDMQGRVGAAVREVARERITAARPGWSIRDIPYDQAALTAKARSSSLVMAYAVERVQKDISALIKANGLDAAIVVTSFKSDDLSGDGVGVMLRAGFGSINSAWAYSNTQLALLGPEGQILALGWAGRPESRPLTGAYNFSYNLEENSSMTLIAGLRGEIEQALRVVLGKQFDAMDFRQTGMRAN